jgi:hypothetical protein
MHSNWLVPDLMIAGKVMHADLLLEGKLFMLISWLKENYACWSAG